MNRKLNLVEVTEKTLAPRAIFINLKGVPEETRTSLSISKKSLYGDSIWDLSHEHPELDAKSTMLDFTKLTFNDGENLVSPSKKIYLSQIKEFYYSILFDPPSTFPKWTTACHYFTKGIRHIIRFMNDNELHYFSEFTNLEFNKFLSELAENNSSGKKTTNRALMARAQGLSNLVEQSSKLEHGFVINPFNEYGTATQWASQSCQTYISKKQKTTIEMPDEVAQKLFNKALSSLEISITLPKLLETRKFYKTDYKTHKGQKIAINPFPWHDYGVKSGHEAKSFFSRLSAACYIIIAMLTGMRFHEIVALESDISKNWETLEITQDDHIRIACFIVSKTNKLQAEPTLYRWQTLPIVKNALEAATIGLAYTRKNGSFLFPSPRDGEVRLGHTVLLGYLKNFVVYHNIRYNGELWPISTHQFRKKFARIMTRQGLGLKALQDQLKHFDIEMTRHYSDINLYSELQKEKFSVSSEIFEEIITSQVPVIGGGATELKKIQKQFLGMATADRQKFLSSLPTRTLIEQVDDGLCIYRPEKALCGGNKSACRPADCNNSIIKADGKRKIFEWRKEENIKLLGFFNDEPLKSAYLNDRISELDKLLLQLDEIQDNFK